jgi:prohibitin 1
VAQANGQAQAILAVATAQAEANRKLAESLTANLVAYKQLEKWDGKLPQVSGGATPFINLQR